MNYEIIKVHNGLWRLEWENGKYSEHSTQDGAQRMVIAIENTRSMLGDRLTNKML